MDLIERLRAGLGDRYEIERELGRGGMATVFLAQDRKHDRPVAVKVLHDELSAAVGAERFQREIQIAGRLTHPNILPMYDSGALNGSLYYVMPYVTGESLRDRLKRERQLPIDEAAQIACEVADALAHAHRNGIIHRDVKPENILLQDGHAVVADFGIARAMSESGEHITVTGVSIGTPGYMSPEQASAEPMLDGRTDQYSLGCVLYEMLAGEPPFTGPTPLAIIARHTVDPVPPLRTVRDTVPPALEAVVLRALAKSPADRFPTLTEFARALTGRSTGSTAYPIATSSMYRTAQRSRRKLIALGAVAVIAAIIVARLAVQWLDGTDQLAAGELDFFPRQQIAVLYFEDESTDGELAYLADGLTEGLIDELGRVDRLNVISRNGVLPFRDSVVGYGAIAEALKVGTLVHGQVVPRGDRVQLNVQLVDGNSGGDEIDRATFDVPRSAHLAMRDSLTDIMAGFLRRRLGQDIVLQRSRAGTTNQDAWSLLQRGERARKESEEHRFLGDGAAADRRVREADSLFSLIERLDPEWTAPILARASLATSRVRATADRRRQAELIEAGLGHSERALAMEPENAEALEFRGTLRYYKRLLGHVLDPNEQAALVHAAEEDLTRATQLAPERATAWNTLSLLLYRKYDKLGAHNAAQNAYMADTYLSAAPEVIWRLYATSYDLEQFEKAREWCEVGRRRYPKDPQFTVCQLWLLTAPDARVGIDEAWRLLDSLEARVPEARWHAVKRPYQMMVAIPIARAGLVDSAHRVIERSRGDRETDPQGELVGQEVLVRTLIGETDEAIRLLQSYLVTHPEHRQGFTRAGTWWWRPLQNDPRFKALVGTR